MSILHEQAALPRRVPRVDDPDAQRIFEKALVVAGMAIGLIDDPNLRGLYFHIGLASEAFIHEPIGIVPAHLAEQYKDASRRIAWQLAKDRRSMATDQYCDPANMARGGAVDTGDWLLGAYGPPMMRCEAIVVVTAVLSGLKPVDWALKIAESNMNGYIVSFLKRLDLLDHSKVGSA